jgi:WD40 repeat protein
MVLIGHSMGGLVIKYAYIIGHRDPTFQDVVDRVVAMFFLGVPHQGAALSGVLDRLLKLHGDRPFVSDLGPSSPVVEAINSDFPRLSTNLKLFSFFETKGMAKLGLIVPREAAVLNYVNERRQYLDCNHRDVARFSSADDQSYLAIRNSLAALVDEYRRSPSPASSAVALSTFGESSLGESLKEEVSRFLGVYDAPEDDFMTQDGLRLPGSCEWLFRRENFVAWRDSLSSRVYWLKGRPGAGKSVLSSAIISHLRERQKDCCFFYFIKSDRSKVSISAFLRSMAFQMALKHPEIMETIAQVAGNLGDTQMDKQDLNVVFRKLYLMGILKVRLNRPQFWIMDALDEAGDSQELTAVLEKIQEHWPLCAFVTSRSSEEVYSNTVAMKLDIVADRISEADNATDIALFLDKRIARFPAATLEGKKQMAEQIVRNAQGCFLWAQVVVRELLQVRTASQAEVVLRSNPSDMDEVYIRILDDIAGVKANQDLVKAVLTWAVCSNRPMSADELREAVQLHLKDEVSDIESAVRDCCGNLVYFDAASKRLKLLHLTVKEFLLKDDIQSEYRVDRSNGNKQLAVVCLEHLANSGTKTGRPGRQAKRGGLASQIHTPGKPSAFGGYALEHAFYHVSQTRSYDEGLVALVAKFFRSPAGLGWIETLAKRSDLRRIFFAGKTIQNLLERRSEFTPAIAFAQDREFLRRWGNDLVHLVTKFGKRLLATPHAIHHLIPPFCPPSSAIFELASRPNGMAVLGLRQQGWDDCISTLSFTAFTRPNVVAFSGDHVALGTMDKKVILYDNDTFQEALSIQHSEPIWSLVFGENSKVVAMAGPRTIKIWDVARSRELQSFRTNQMCLAMAFDDNDTTLWAAMRNNFLLCLDITTGEMRQDPVNWTAELAAEAWQPHARAATNAWFCVHMGLLAVAYRGEDLLLWDLADESIYDVYEKRTGSWHNESLKTGDGGDTIYSATFTAPPETTLLAVGYLDGDVVLFDTETGLPAGSVSNVWSQVMTSSPDGRTLASGDASGSISLFDFPTLRFLYKIRYQRDPIAVKALGFTSDSLRLVELRASQCTIWEPSELLRQDDDGGSADAGPNESAPLEVGYENREFSEITALASLRSSPLAFCGKADGTVHVLDTKSVSKERMLFEQTRNCPVFLLNFDTEGNLLTCRDAASAVTVRRLSQRARGDWEVSPPLFDSRPSSPVVQVLTSGKHARLLLVTESFAVLWPLGDAAKEESSPIAQIERSCSTARWVCDGDPDLLIYVGETEAVVYSWETLARCRKVNFAALHPPVITSVMHLHHPRFFATVSRDSSDRWNGTHRSAIQIWDMETVLASHDSTAAAAASSPPAKVQPAFDLSVLATLVLKTIGIYGDRFVFLDQDYWVCSMALPTDGGRRSSLGSPPARSSRVPATSKSRGPAQVGAAAEEEAPSSPRFGAVPAGPSSPDIGSLVRHFPLPYDWISSSSSLQVDLGRGGEIIFVKRDELAIIRNGLEVSETGAHNPRRPLPGQRLSGGGSSSSSGVVAAGGLPLRPVLQSP